MKINSHNSISLNAATLVIVSLISIIAPAISNCQGGITDPEKTLYKICSVDDIVRDPRLTQIVNIAASSQTIGEVLAELSKISKVHFAVDKALARRRITLYSLKGSMCDIMFSISNTTNFSWRISEDVIPNQSSVKPIDYDYQLCLMPEAKINEARLIRLSESREQRVRENSSKALLDAISKSISNPNQNKSLLPRLLSSLSNDQLSQLAKTGSESSGVISASNNSHLLNHLLFLSPVGDLSASIQATLAEGLNSSDMAKNISDLQRCQVGFTAADGTIRLAIVKPGSQDIWVSPTDEIHRGYLSDVDSDNDTDPEVLEALQAGKIVDLANMSTQLKYKKLRFPNSLDRTKLTVLLKYIAEQTGLNTISDDYLNSRTTIAYWLLTDRTEYTLEQALIQIAGAFGHRISYKNHSIQAKTAALGLDLRLELPEKIEGIFDDLIKTKRLLTLEDYLEFARLSKRQLTLLWVNQRPKDKVQFPYWKIRSIQEILRYYSSLSKNERKKAEEQDGLYFNALNSTNRNNFLSLCNIGLHTENTSLPKFDHEGIYVRREKLGKQEIITFYIVAGGNQANIKSYKLTVP